MKKIEITDRYDALGIERPNLQTMCKGHCEGTGYFPENDQTSKLWKEAHSKSKHEEKTLVKFCGGHAKETWPNCKNCIIEDCDGWHFVKCPDCNGTGRTDGTSVWGNRS